MKEKKVGDGSSYSDKGGHRERSTFWTEVRGLRELLAREAKFHPRMPAFYLQPVPILEQARQIRRQMRRITDSGRR